MESNTDAISFDVVIIGSGPAGQKAAIEATKSGKSTLLIEQERSVGGACVHRGTIPSKTLRETAVSLLGFKRRTGSVFEVNMPPDLQVMSLMTRMEQVIKGHEHMMRDQLHLAGVSAWHGRARFMSAQEVEVVSVIGERRRVRAERFIIATGSKPRSPKEIPIDHEHILDSDSVLSMIYLPESLTVLGAGVIASEYASIFAALGVKVTMIDRGERPVAFLDSELTDRFITEFERVGGRFIGGAKLSSVEWNGIDAVVTTLTNGRQISSEKLLCALGREANLSGLHVEAAGIAPNERGLLVVNQNCQTSVPTIYAVGDVIGPPSLASTSAEQGRRAMSHALGIDSRQAADTIPMAIYTIPEMAAIGLTEQQAIQKYGSVIVGRARLEELARGQIAAIENGLLKLISDPSGMKLVGAHVVGEGAAELIHIAQMVLTYGGDIDVFVDSIFNFPTLAESYRVAALEIVSKRRAAAPQTAASKNKQRAENSPLLLNPQ